MSMEYGAQSTCTDKQLFKKKIKWKKSGSFISENTFNTIKNIENSSQSWCTVENITALYLYIVLYEGDLYGYTELW